MSKKLNYLVAALIFAAGVSSADSARYSATLAEPVKAKKDFIVNGNVWRCEASTCFVASSPTDAASLDSCFTLRQQVGALTAFGLQDKPFDAGRLARCNAGRR